MAVRGVLKFTYSLVVLSDLWYWIWRHKTPTLWLYTYFAFVVRVSLEQELAAKFWKTERSSVSPSVDRSQRQFVATAQLVFYNVKAVSGFSNAQFGSELSAP